MIPADPKSNNRLVYVPRASLKDFRILGMQYSRGDLLEYFQNSHQSKGTEPLSPAEFVSGAADSLPILTRIPSHEPDDIEEKQVKSLPLGRV